MTMTLEEIRAKYKNIPEELKRLNQWACFKPIDEGGIKPRKMPINPKSGEPADSSDPSSCGSFEEAISFFYHNQQEIKGIKFLRLQKD